MRRPGPTTQFWLRCVLALGFLFVATAQGARAPSEYDVKVVYLYNFTKFVSWPDKAFEGPASPLNICIMGNLPDVESIKALKDKKSRNRSIIVRLLEPNADDSRCHILFLTKTIDYAVAKKIMTAIKHPTLIVGETSGFAKSEGVIGFILDERRRVRIEINLDNAKSQDLTIRAQLLEIARKVYRDQEGA